MDVRSMSPFLALLLMAVIGYVDASGRIMYFNVSSTRVHQEASIVFRCGASISGMDLSSHTLLVHIRKWFEGSPKWLLSVNEQLEVRSVIVDRYNAEIHSDEEIKEIEFTIYNARPEDTAYYTCDSSTNNMTVHVDVMSEPKTLTLKLNDQELGRVSTEVGHLNTSGEEVTVKLGQRYSVDCTVLGGNPDPNVTLTSGREHFGDVVITRNTSRDTSTPVSVPMHRGSASVNWMPTIDNIGRQLRCSAGVENLRALSTYFMPIVEERQPLIACADRVRLEGDDNDLEVSCRIVSVHAPLHNLTVRVFGPPNKDFQINCQLPRIPGRSMKSSNNQYNGYEAEVDWHETSKSWDLKVMVKNARSMSDLSSTELEIMAANPFDISTHVVGIDHDSSAKLTVSMAILVLSLILGVFCRP